MIKANACRCLSIFALVGFVVTGFAAPVRGQSIGEISQKAKEAREKAAADRAKAESDAKAKTSADSPATGDRTPPSDAASKSPARKVFTNDSLKELSPSPDTASALSVAPPTPSTPKESTTKTESNKPGEPVRDEVWWKARMTGLRATLEQAQIAYAAKVALVARLEAVRDSVPDHGFSVAQAYAAASAELAKAKADRFICAGAVDAARAAVNVAEEEARRSGVLPGWLR